MTEPALFNNFTMTDKPFDQKAKQRFTLFAFFAVVPFLLTGCTSSSTEDSSSSVAPPVMKAEVSDEPVPVTVRELRKLLKVNELAKFQKVGNDIVAAELYQSGVKDISALKNVPLRRLDLGFTEVTDISALAGMPLTYLNLEETKIDDLSSLKGMQLEELHLHSCPLTNLDLLDGMPLQRLNLSKIPVASIAACASMPLQTLWIPNTKVTDISPLAGKTMQSLDIEGTDVADLSPLADMKTLQRLNIVNTKVTDLTPLAGLPLVRISLTPGNITNGIEVLRDMPTLSAILTTTVGASTQSAAQFWSKYDAGVYKDEPEASVDEPKAKADESKDADAVEPAKADPAEKNEVSAEGESTEKSEAAADGKAASDSSKVDKSSDDSE